MTTEEQLHEQQSQAVARAVSNLATKLGYSPEVIFEGAMYGAAAVMMASGVPAHAVGDLFEEVAENFRLAPDPHRVVQ